MMMMMMMMVVVVVMITPAAAVENITAAREYMVSEWWNPRYTKQPLDDDECYYFQQVRDHVTLQQQHVTKFKPRLHQIHVVGYM